MNGKQPSALQTTTKSRLRRWTWVSVWCLVGENVSVGTPCFVLAAAGTTKRRPLTVAIGIHALTDYYDTTTLFIKHTQRLLNGYSGGSVTLSAPFLADTKAEVIRFAKDNSVPLRLTYSCERQNAPACGECLSCRDRNEL